MVTYVLWLPYCATVFRSVYRSSFFFFFCFFCFFLFFFVCFLFFVLLLLLLLFLNRTIGIALIFKKKKNALKRAIICHFFFSKIVQIVMFLIYL